MPRSYPQSDFGDPDRDSGAGEWHALRGELVALLDKVENRYGQAEPEPEPKPAVDGLAKRVRNLRDQMNGTENATRRREALRTVKRAVDRFSERDDSPFDEEADDLTAAIAEIRSRQGAVQQPMRRTDAPEIRELGALVGGMSQRLERLEGELKSQRGDGGNVREVAGQVEQLTQVVELLAGAIGETGQVRRLEAQMAALGAMIEEGPRSDLAIINARLDDVSATVGKLAELQAEQMEREIVRETRAAEQKPEQLSLIVPAMEAIEAGIRNVYDRIDVIERTVGLSSSEFEKLTGDMAAFTKAMKDGGAAPKALMGKLEALAERIEGFDAPNGEVAGLKQDISALRETMLKGMEPRFAALENQIEALSGKLDGGAVESQLKALMARMDDAAAQLDGLARLQSGEGNSFESLANMVAERTSEAMAKKTPPAVAMFGPESLKSIEDRLTGLIKSAGKTPDYDVLADMIASRASEAVAKSAPPAVVAQGDGEGMQALEKRMTAILNTAGKDTADRLARLEAMLAERKEGSAKAEAPTAKVVAPKEAVTVSIAKPTEVDPFAEALQPKSGEASKLDDILAELARGSRDAMPSNPSDDAPLIDPGFKREPGAKPISRSAMAAPTLKSETVDDYAFYPNHAQKPPRPQSSLAGSDPFAAPVVEAKSASPVAPTVASSTSTFVAAARRAQRAKQEEAPPAVNNSIIGRALARVKPRKEEAGSTGTAAPVVTPVVEAKPEKPQRKVRESKAELPEQVVDDAQSKPGFLTRHRRPLLLAATLVAVSMLALNLVMQRMNADDADASAESAAQVVPETNNPSPSDDQSSAVPPRVVDMVDTTSTGSINPGEPMSFSKGQVGGAIPPAIAAIDAKAEPNVAAAPVMVPSPPADILTTGSVNRVATSPETFELPAETVGPLELREAAAQGSAQAQFEVAAVYGEGGTGEKNPAEAAKWYERSAAQGFAPAQYRLGNLYESGMGVEQDLEQARLWYQRAAESGNRMAMHNLAAIYAGGQLGDQEFELAAEWFNKAADRGMTDSQFNLGMLYARGLGVEQSFEQSFKWFSLAALNGDNDAAQARDDIAKSLSAEAVGRVSEDIKAWRMAEVDFAANFAPIGTWSPQFDPGAPITGKDVVIKVQQALTKLGFDVGVPDGVAGPKTADAIKAFESATGMNAVGSVNPRLLAVLGSQPV